MMHAPTEAYLVLAALIFTVGATGIVLRRTMLVQLMSLELMLNAANLVLIAGNRAWPGAPSGQVLTLLVLAIAAAEAAVGLALIIAFYRIRQTTAADAASMLRA